MSLLNGIGYSNVTLTADTPEHFIFNEDNPHFYANRVSVKNIGTSTIRFKVNVDIANYTEQRETAMSLGSKETFTCVGDGRPPISSIVVESVGAAGTVSINAF